MVGREPELESNLKFDWTNLSASLQEADNQSRPDPEEINATLLTGSYQKRKFTDSDYCHHLAMPLIQVFRVDIVPSFGDGKACQIYGSVEAFKGTRCCSHLYSREREDFEEIAKGGTLSLISPSDAPIFPSMTTTLNICLEDKIRGVKVVDGNLRLNPGNDDSYDRLLREDVPGPHGYARVFYVVFRFAHVFMVHVKVTKTDNDDKNGIANDIFGSIVAGYPNDGIDLSDYEPMKRLETQLFKRPSDKPLGVAAGTPTILSRYVVVAPVYTSLDLKVDLWDSNKKIAWGCLQFPAHKYDQNLQYIQTDYACVEVIIDWRSAISYSEYKEQDAGHELSKVLSDQRLSASSTPSTAPKPMTCFGVEVFSVFVGGVAKQITSLCGVILIKDGGNPFSIYNRDDKDCEILPTSNLVSIEVNYRAILNCDFEIDLYLKDPNANLEVCRGNLGWNIAEVECISLNYSFYSKRMCSVVRGDDGYAAVHYSIFCGGYQASIRVELKPTTHGHSNVPLLLYGTLFGRYSGYEYTTSYDKKYYQSRLFDCAEDKPVKVQFDEEVTLLKSFVMVPPRSCLIIEANLGIVNGEEFCGLAEFHSNILSDSLTLRGQHYDIEVTVVFAQ